MKTRTLIFSCLAIFLIGIGLLISLHSTAQSAVKKPVDFSLTDINGKTVQLSDYRGKVVIVDFWATWCGYCVKEIPGLIQLQTAAIKGKKPLQIIGIAVDTDRSKVEKFAKDHKINYPILLAPGNGSTVRPFGDIYGLPTKFIIDKNGVIVDKIIGSISMKDLQKKIAKYL